MFNLTGLKDYPIIDYEINESVGKLTTMRVTTLSDYYYDFKYETGKIYFKKDNKILFTGVIDNMDYNFEDGTLVIYMTEYVGIIAYTSDLLGTGPTYDVTYTSAAASTIASAIFNGTDFNVDTIVGNNIPSMKGSKLTRKEWLEMLLDALICGRDANGNYTVFPANIISDQRKQDIIVDYDDNTVIFGVKGCYRPDITGYVWIQKKINIDKYIIGFNELRDKVYKTKRVIVIGKNGVYGSAYMNTSTDVPVEVITDNSCQDATACNKLAESELNLRYKNNSLTVSVDPSLYYNGNIEVGMRVIITTPLIFSNDYDVIEIKATNDNVELILGSPATHLISTLIGMNDRIKKIERW